MKDLEGSLAAWHRQTYLSKWGRIVKTEEDLERYAQLLERVRPTLIIETGTWTGCSAKWFADQPCHPRVVSIDIQPVQPAIDHEQFRRTDPDEHLLHVEYVSGSSIDPVIFRLVCRRVADSPGPVLVVLDSDHSRSHVFAEMCLYAPLVTVGSYLVVEDGILRYFDASRLTGLGIVGSPLDAIEQFLAAERGLGQFVLDEDLEDLFPTTQFPGGWLRRVA